MPDVLIYITLRLSVGRCCLVADPDSREVVTFGMNEAYCIAKVQFLV